jgi:hypothetical protein
MKIKTSILVTAILVVSACTTTRTQQEAEAINIECGFEMQAARTAIRLRDKGTPKATLEAQLVPVSRDSSRLLIKMHEIANEAYQYTELNETVYATYRFELCQRELINKPMPGSLEQVMPQLMHCQDRFANQSSAQSTQCILVAIRNAAEKHPN